MLNRKVADVSLYQFTDYQLDKMWLNAEIDKCPVCGRYHEKTLKTFIIYNLSLCLDCEKQKNILESWLNNG